MFFKRLFNMFTILCAITLVLSSCLLPEKFSCSVDIKTDGSYSVAFKGTVVDFNVLKAMQEGLFSEEGLSDIVENYKSGGYFSVVKAAKNGRIYVESFHTASDGSPLEIFEGMAFISVGLDSGAIKVSIVGSEPDMKETLSSFGYKIDGSLIITSEIPIENAGTNKIQKIGKKSIIKKTFKELPKVEETISFANDVTKKMKGPEKHNSSRVSSDWLE